MNTTVHAGISSPHTM